MPRKKKEPEPEKYIVFWWMSKEPYCAEFDNRMVAEASANVRNALMITFQGKIVDVVDWYRRSHEDCHHKNPKEAEACGDGKPMPANWRDIGGQVHAPWLSSSVGTRTMATAA